MAARSSTRSADGVVWRASRVVVAAAAVGITTATLVTGGAASAAATPGTETCDDETHLWVGDALLDAPGARLDTGLSVVAPGIGVDLSVVGVSADGADAAGRVRPLAVFVGSGHATVGTAAGGGAISAVHDADGAGALRVVGVTVVLRRCTVVASLAAPAPPPAAPPAAASGPAVSAPAVSAPAGAAPVAPAVVTSTSGAVLPQTGDAPWTRSLIGASLVALGCAMVSFGRRRPVVAAPRPTARPVTAGGHAPGSPLDAPPHARR